MFKLFINNVQVGNYFNYKDMVRSLLMIYAAGKTCTSMQNIGKSLYVRFAD